jgi:hypothetical protein
MSAVRHLREGAGVPALAPVAAHRCDRRARSYRGNLALAYLQATGATSGYVCPVNDQAELFVVGVVVTPDDVPADHASPLLVGGAVGARQARITAGPWSGFDPVQP